MYSAYKLIMQGDNIQPWHTPFLSLWLLSISNNFYSGIRGVQFSVSETYRLLLTPQREGPFQNTSSVLGSGSASSGTVHPLESTSKWTYSPLPSLTLALFCFLFSASPPAVLCPLPFPGALPQARSQDTSFRRSCFSRTRFISSPSSRLGPDLTWCANHSGWKSDSLALCAYSQHSRTLRHVSLYTYHHLSVSVTHYTCLTDCLKQFKNGGDPGMEPTRMSTRRGKDKADAAHTYNGVVLVVPEKGPSELEGGLGWRPKERGWTAESHPGWGEPGVGRGSTGRLSSPCDSVSWVPAFTSLFSGSVHAEGEDWVVRSIKCLQGNLHQRLLGTQRWTGHIRDTVGLCLTCTSPRSQWMKFVTEKNILSCHVWRNT